MGLTTQAQLRITAKNSGNPKLKIGFVNVSSGAEHFNTVARASPSIAASCEGFAQPFAGCCGAVISAYGRSSASIRRWSKVSSQKVVLPRVSSIFYCEVWLRICWLAIFSWVFLVWPASTTRQTTRPAINAFAKRHPIVLRSGHVASSRETFSPSTVFYRWTRVCSGAARPL